MAKCNECNKCIYNVSNNNAIRCSLCSCYYHKKCTNVNSDYNDWFCLTCTCDIFPFNQIIDDDEFLFTIRYFDNCHDYNKFLDLKFNLFLFEIGIDDPSSEYLQNLGVSNSCNYVFDPTSYLKSSSKPGFSILHLNVRSFHKNQDLINAFISNLNL